MTEKKPWYVVVSSRSIPLQKLAIKIAQDITLAEAEVQMEYLQDALDELGAEHVVALIDVEGGPVV